MHSGMHPWDERDDMNIGAMNITGKHLGIGAAVVVGGLAIGGLVMLARGPKEQDVNDKLLGEFGRFDNRPKDNAWTSAEAVQFNRSGPSWTPWYTKEVRGNVELQERYYQTTETTRSMERMFQAARGNDAVASLQELRAVALRFDYDGNGTLGRNERSDFDRQFESTANTRTTRLDTDSRLVERYPDNGGYRPPNGPGDSPGNGGNYPPGNGGGTPGNGGGDTPLPGNGGTRPPGNGGTRPPGNGGGSPGNGGGDTGPANPNPGDF
jgi:hypothetical protein